MNTDRRVLIVTRRFWPTMTDATLRLSHWVQELWNSGVRPTIVSSRPNKEWPKKIFYGEIPVIRLDDRPSNPLRGDVFSRQLVEWLGREITHYKLLYFDQLDQEVNSFFARFKDDELPPVVIRYDAKMFKEGSGKKTVKPELAVFHKASAIVVATAEAQKRLRSAGIIERSVVRINDGPMMKIDRSIGARREARKVLSDINHDLFTRSTDKVILCPGELTAPWCIDLLVKALGELVEQCKNLRLWILGDGPQRNRLYDSLRHAGLQRVVIMPGVFTDIEQVLQVADLCVFPGPGVGTSWLARNCAINNIPMILADSPEARVICGELHSLLTFEVGSPEGMRRKVEKWIRDRAPVDRAALELQRLSFARHNPQHALGRFLSLIDEHSVTS